MNKVPKEFLGYSDKVRALQDEIKEICEALNKVLKRALMAKVPGELLTENEEKLKKDLQEFDKLRKELHQFEDDYQTWRKSILRKK